MKSLQWNKETFEGYNFSAADFNLWAEEPEVLLKTSMMYLTGSSDSVMVINKIK